MRGHVGRQYVRLRRSREALGGNMAALAACDCGAVFANDKSANRTFSAASSSAQPSSSSSAAGAKSTSERFFPTKTFKHLLRANLNEKERLLKALAERLRFFFSDGKGRSRNRTATHVGF